MHLPHKDAFVIIQTILEELETAQRGGAVAVTDAHGELMAFVRTDGCALPSLYNAINKAFTAARRRVPTRQFREEFRKEGLSISYFGDARYTGLGGGIPLIVDGEVIGGVGVSGLSEQEDIDLAEKGIRHFEERQAG